MTLEELYAQVGGNYEEAVTRLMNEALVGRFILKFSDDTSCADLFAAWDSGDEAAAFEAAHAAKGVCMNLALTSLAEPASKITEALRPGNGDLREQTDVDRLVGELREAHAGALRAIAAYGAQ